MKVKMLTLAAGPLGVWRVGQVVDVPDAVARSLIANGGAEAVKGMAQDVEEATAPAAPERAVVRGRKRP